MKHLQLCTLILVSLLVSCEKRSPIEGLWLVNSVRVGGEKMTPNARWTRFNEDFTQESGNGRFQHSYGTWKFNKESNELKIENSNGIKDPSPPFEVKFIDDEMVWKREEEGQNVVVTLERSDELPESFGDQLLGLWSLENAKGEGKYFQTKDAETDNAFIHFRWDKRFNLTSSKGRINGVYNVHGHRPEVELIPYGVDFDRDFWKIDFEENSIVLTRLNSDQVIERKFLRIHEFPK